MGRGEETNFDSIGFLELPLCPLDYVVAERTRLMEARQILSLRRQVFDSGFKVMFRGVRAFDEFSNDLYSYVINLIHFNNTCVEENLREARRVAESQVDYRVGLTAFGSDYLVSMRTLQ